MGVRKKSDIGGVSNAAHKLEGGIRLHEHLTVYSKGNSAPVKRSFDGSLASPVATLSPRVYNAQISHKTYTLKGFMNENSTAPRQPERPLQILAPSRQELSDTRGRPLRDLRISVTDRCN
jgi:hypothetical protein